MALDNEIGIKKGIDTVIFDFDGTLTDSMLLFEKIVRNALLRFKKSIINLGQEKIIAEKIYGDSLHNQFRGGKLMIFKIFYYLARIFNLGRTKSIFFTFYCLFKIQQVYHKAPLKSDTIKVLSLLQSKNKKLGLVSMASKKDIERKKSILKYFQVIITRDDVNRVKPHPEGLLRALKALKSSPQNAIYIGDLPIDIQAAKNANMMCIGLKSDLVSEEMMNRLQPELVCQSLTEAVRWINSGK
ncbi:MAG: HAD family hydrolase [Candidatus Hodarchaeales archaeon]